MPELPAVEPSIAKGRSARSDAVTAADVARRAGVSLATVSRVLNGSTRVDAQLCARVQHAVRELGFQPNIMAQALRRGNSNVVALIVGDVAQQHFSQLTVPLQAEFEAMRIELMLFNLGHVTDRLPDFLSRAVGMRMRGVVVAVSDALPAPSSRRLAELESQGMQVLSIGQDLTEFGVSSIVHEERAATRRAAEHLLSRGHRRIAYLGRIRGSAVGSARFHGTRDALVAAGVFDQDLVWDRAYRYEAGYGGIVDALDRGLHFSAVQCGSDEIAMGVMAALRDRGLRVPQDISVVGFGNIPLAAYLRPALTTLGTHSDEAARRVCEWFRADNAAPHAATLLEIPRELILRES